jgi:hypothetical protein
LPKERRCAERAAMAAKIGQSLRYITEDLAGGWVFGFIFPRLPIYFFPVNLCFDRRVG